LFVFVLFVLLLVLFFVLFVLHILHIFLILREFFRLLFCSVFVHLVLSLVLSLVLIRFDIASSFLVLCFGVFSDGDERRFDIRFVFRLILSVDIGLVGVGVGIGEDCDLRKPVVGCELNGFLLRIGRIGCIGLGLGLRLVDGCKARAGGGLSLWPELYVGSY